MEGFVTMRDFIYEIPVKVYFGREQFGHLGQELSRHGKKVLRNSRRKVQWESLREMPCKIVPDWTGR